MAPLLEHRKLPPQPRLPEATFQICVNRQQLQPPPCARTSGHSKAPPHLLRPLLLAPIIGIVGLVVHYQLVVDEVKAVRTGLIGIFNHQTNYKLEGKKCKELYVSLSCGPGGEKLSIPSKFPGNSVVKNPLANAGDTRDAGLIPGSGRSPGGRNGNPLQCSCLGNPKDRGARWGYSPWGCKELGMAEHPHTKVHKPALPENVSMCYQNNELRTEEARPGERGDLGPQRPPNGACHPLPQQEATSAGPGPPWPSSAWCSVRTLGRGARPSANMHQSS